VIHPLRKKYAARQSHQMTDVPQTDREKQPSPSPNLDASGFDRRLLSFGLATLGLALCFGIPLWNLIRFAAGSGLYSYILLIPFISAYLVWVKKQNLPLVFKPIRGTAAAFIAAGAVVLIAYWFIFRPRLKLVEADYLAVMTISFLLFFSGIYCLLLGKEMLRATAFSLGFLVFMIPIPAIAVFQIDSFLQNGSAAVAQTFFRLSGTPFFQDGLVFQLPDISLQIAPECSGIHSSLVLLITSVLASYLFLRTPWKRTVFILAVVPLAILRNGFRVFTIGELCVHIGPQMINSPIHHKGGPIFFILSLIPLFILLILLQKSERRGAKSNCKTVENPNSKLQE
jgi:exosortase C (VPDSG-CTERM-specific)